ncbi:MAG: L,D-transpeptidase family protein [Alphaproteobacteria bacterium]|nr:L,D-transpeptidase family protein [Alphaproteobacteria bacterium]
MLTVYPTEQSRGVLQFEGGEYPCALGRNGIQQTKREGDGATPAGTFALRQVFYRPDRLAPPACQLPIRALTTDDGWCDDPAHAAYNRLVERPFAASHEVMWRADNLYDVVIAIGHNDDPPRAPMGSAIFIHCAAADFAPTEGCVALARETLVALIPRFRRDTELQVRERQAGAP